MRLDQHEIVGQCHGGCETCSEATARRVRDDRWVGATRLTMWVGLSVPTKTQSTRMATYPVGFGGPVQDIESY